MVYEYLLAMPIVREISCLVETVCWNC